MDAERDAAVLGGPVDRIVERIAQAEGQAGGQNLEADDLQLGGGAADFLGGGLRIAHRQHAHRLDARAGVIGGEVIVAGAGRGDGEIGLLQLGHIA